MTDQTMSDRFTCSGGVKRHPGMGKFGVRGVTCNEDTTSDATTMPVWRQNVESYHSRVEVRRTTNSAERECCMLTTVALS